MDESFDDRMKEWMDTCMYEWVHVQMRGYRYKLMNGLINDENICMYRQMTG